MGLSRSWVKQTIRLVFAGFSVKHTTRSKNKGNDWLEIRIMCPSGMNRIGGVMAIVLASSAVDRGFEPRSGCFSAKHAALRRKSKDWLARNQNNVSEWSDMSIRGLLFQ